MTEVDTGRLSLRGWRLDRAFWGRGLATEAARASVALGLERIIQPENGASRRVAEKAGLTFRGETRWRGSPPSGTRSTVENGRPEADG